MGVDAATVLLKPSSASTRSWYTAATGAHPRRVTFTVIRLALRYSHMAKIPEAETPNWRFT